MIGTHGRVVVNTIAAVSEGGEDKTLGVSNAAPCFAAAAMASGMMAQASALGDCLGTLFGVECRNFATALDVATHNASTGVSEGWGADWRDSTWNCSLIISKGNGLVDSPGSGTPGLASAMCQDAIVQDGMGAAAVADRMSKAPNETAKFYRVVREPQEVTTVDAGTMLPKLEVRAKSWVVPGKKRLPEGRDEGIPVIYDLGELRDAVLVVGAGESVSQSPVEIFIRTLRATGCRAEVVMFLDSRCIKDFFWMGDKYGGIRFIEFDAKALEDRYRFSKPVVVYRFVLYEHYLRTSPTGRYRNCLHADLFDIYFQRDPFKTVEIRGGLAIFTENSQVPMGSCRYHRMWFAQCKEWTLLHRVHGMPRICMGVVFGAVSAFVKFLELSLHRMLQHCNDQGVLNILATSGQYAEIMSVTIYTPHDGPVLHVNTDWQFSIDETGMVLNPSGSPYAIVHQWDRIFKAHPKDIALRPFKTELDKRKVWQENYWNGDGDASKRNKWAGNGKVVPQCVALDVISGSVVCRTGPHARHGSNYALFCPTHTEITELSKETLKQAAAYLPANPTDAEATIAVAAQSEHQVCISHMVMAGRCKEAKHWCNVKQNVVKGALEKCNADIAIGQAPTQAKDNPLGYAGDNLLYGCTVPTVLELKVEL
jgi:hypothetical protein